MKKIYIFLIFITSFSFGQTGPAGIGNATGASGQPENIIWLDAGTLGLGDGAAVTTWADLSGNGNDFVQQGTDPTPLFETNGLFTGNHSTVRFDGTERYLVLGDNADLDNSLGGITIIAVIYNATLDNSPRGIYSKRISSGSNRSYNTFTYSSSRLNFDIDNGSNQRLASTISLNTSTDYISTNRYSGSLQEIYLQSVQSGSASISGDITDSNSDLLLGALNNNYGTYFDGDIAELIFYREALNDGERLIIENYLSQKYGITITNDFFGNDAGFDAAFVNDFMGIGTGNGSNKFSTSGFSDALEISEANGSLNSANEFIMMAHDNTAHADGITADLTVDPGILDSRWARSWFLEVTGTVSTEMRFDFGTAGLAFSGDASDYVLLYRPTTSDDYTRILANSYSVENGDQLVVDLGNISLPSGYYTVGEGEQLVAGNWYSFQSGDWNDPLTWTTISDGSLREPVIGGVPTAGDNVTILSGRTVTMDSDDNDGVTLEVNGRLDIEGTSGHNFFSIEGNGVISIEGDASSNDNFPSGNITLFADSIVGGTVEVLGSGVNLDVSRTFNNMLISLDGAADVATLLADYTINGDLNISNGILQINDNSATTSLNITTYGGVQIDATGELNVGTANARHEFNFYGDFINQGRAEFTNRVATDYGSEATDGIIDANFLSGISNQVVDCNGVTNFYRIEVDKGNDITYILDINASSAANFNLFGPADYGHASTAQLTTNNNNLGLLRGTVRLNANVDVPVLNNTGNYNISEAARLWVNGGSAEKPTGTAIVPYGTIQISDGILNAPINSGITTRANGNIVIEGGTVTVNQIRTSVLGVENIGGYTQSGGTVNVIGNNISTSYYAFSLTYPGNTFNMSGGTLNVAGAPTGANTGGIFIASSVGNQSVTGGTVVMEIDRNNEFKVTSLAPFWNVIMRYTSGTGSEVDLINGASGTGGNITTITTPDLRVLNDLTIESGITFDHNGFDVEVGSDFTVEAGAEYLFDDLKPNTLVLNGVDNSQMALYNISAGGAANEVQKFYNLTIDKPSDKTVTLASGKTGANLLGFQNNLFRVDGEAFKVLSGTLDQGVHSVLANCDSVVNYGTLTVYNVANGSVNGVNDVDSNPNGNNDQLKFASNQGGPTDIVFLTSDDAVIGNLKFFMQTFVVDLTSDLTIQFLEHSNGRFYIGDNNLKVQFYNEAPGQGFQSGPGLTDMIVTNGNASDGGLSLYASSNKSITYPIGIGLTGASPTSKYTPATATITNFSDDGYVTIRPVDGILGTTVPAGGDILSYYWKVNYEDFTAEPTVQYQFTYDAADDDSGNEATYVAGKVLDLIPFTRRYEDDNTTGVPGVVQSEGVNTGTNTITFNGDADTGFTLEEASYTAGVTTRFIGAPEVYYSRADGNWNASGTWSTVSHASATNSGTFPQAGDIAIVSFNGANFHRVNAVGDLDVAILEFNSLPTATAKTIDLSRVLFGTNEDLNASIVRGIGELQFAGNGANIGNISASTDLGDFVGNKRSSFIYTLGGTSNITIPAIAKYPSLRFYAAGTNSSASKTRLFFLDKDIECSNLLLDGNAALEITTNIVVTDTLFIGANRDGELIFNNGVTANTVETNYLIFGSDLFTTQRADNRNKIFVRTGGGNGTDHRLIVNNDILIATGSAGVYPDLGTSFDLYTNASDNNVILELAGSGNHTFEIEGDDDIGSNGVQSIPEFYRIVMNKGAGITSSFAFNDGFTLEGLTSGVTKALALQKGLLKLNSSEDDINIDLTTGGDDFTISSSAGLQVTQAQVNVEGDNSGILLNGSLIIDGGTVDMDDAVGNGNNFIEYSASGNAILEISSGTLNVGSQIRGITSANTGILKYRQTGGDVRIGTQAAPEGTRGMLQIYNPNSEFTYTGGTLTIERHQTSPTVAALYLDPAVSDVAGSTITIFNGNTPAGQNDFRINSAISLDNLTINGTNSPTATLNINALTIDGQLSIASNATLLGDTRTLTIGGDFVNDGTYDAEGNETIFNTATNQEISGVGTNTFFRFTKEGTGTLTLTNAIDVADLFTITEGTVDDNGNSINLDADAVIDGTHLSVGGNGLVFAGATNQELRRSESGTGSIGIISINNSNGVTVPDGNGYDFVITGGLRLEDGVFNVGGGSILFGTNADITPVSPFSVTNMIQTNSSFVDSGIGKQFTAGYSTDFVMPVGQTFYTPITLDFGTGANTFGTSSGTLIFRPADEYHPTVNDGIPNGALGGTDDIDNVLQYYWTVEANSVTGMTVDMTLKYDQSHVVVDAPAFDETDYIAARILSINNPTYLINKFTSAEVDESTNIITFNFSNADANAITGDYFAGIDEAIPDNVATYTVDVDGGNVGDDVYVETVPGGGAPTGAVVIVPNGFTLSLNQNDIRFYATEIEDGGVLEVNNTTNHRLGELTGTGTLRIISDGINANLPAFSGNFLSCTGGGLEYAGTGSYSILAGVTGIRNLTLSGSGNRNFPNNGVTICEDFVIDGPTVALPSSRLVSVNNDAIVTSGNLNIGSGSAARFFIFNDFLINGGVVNGASNGVVGVVGSLIINGGTYDVGAGAQRVVVLENIELITGQFNSETSSVYLSSTSFEQHIIGDFTGINSFYNLIINNDTGNQDYFSDGNMEITNRLDLIDGKLIFGSSNHLNLSSAATFSPSSGTSNSYVVGKVTKTLGSVGNSFTFPIGSIDQWRPVSVNSVSAGGLTWEAEYFHANPTSEGLVDNLTPTNSSIATISSGEYWKISDGNGAPSGVTATVGLSWGVESDVSTVSSEREELEVMVWNDGLSSWDNLGGGTFSGGHTQSAGTFRATSTASFSENIFTLGSGDAANPLPIVLKSFTGVREGNVHELTWVTSSEINNDYFELQRSADGINYESLVVIDGSGTTLEETAYSYIDKNPLIGKNYYQLVQVDFDGESSVADQKVLLDFIPENTGVEFSIFPNPTNESDINLRVSADSRGEVIITMFDLYGKKVLTKVIDTYELFEDVNLKPDQSLHQGIYLITVEQFGVKKSKRVIITE